MKIPPDITTCINERNAWIACVKLFYNTLQVNSVKISNASDRRPFLHFKILHLSFRGLLDTGAAVNVLCGKLYQSFAEAGFIPTYFPMNINGVDNSVIPTIGKITLPLCFN